MSYRGDIMYIMGLVRTILCEYSTSSKKNLIFLRGIYTYFSSYLFRVQVQIRNLINTKDIKKRKKLKTRILKYYGISIGCDFSCGKHLMIPHPIGIVIGDGVVMGSNCTIYQGVTIGQKNGYYPVIGDNVCIYPNSVILGDIKIGNNVVIGAGSVVINDVCDNAIIAGVPAKEIKKNENVNV
ncbi:MAG: serine acetyltransferase [Clostridia bacterium]|nr:serine acetyltransferase [Clostridia bacterium]